MDEHGEKVRFMTLPWPTEQVALLEKMAADYDMCYVDRPLVNHCVEPVKKKARRKATAATTVKPKPATKVETPAQPATMAEGPIRLSPASIMPMVEGQQRQTIAALVDDLDKTHQVLVQCLKQQAYDQALGQRVFHIQICRLMEIHGLCKSVESVKQLQAEALEEDE